MVNIHLEKTKKLYAYLTSSFHWDETPEGFDYWHAVCAHLSGWIQEQEPGFDLYQYEMAPSREVIRTYVSQFVIWASTPQGQSYWSQVQDRIPQLSGEVAHQPEARVYDKARDTERYW